MRHYRRVCVRCKQRFNGDKRYTECQDCRDCPTEADLEAYYAKEADPHYYDLHVKNRTTLAGLSSIDLGGLGVWINTPKLSKDPSSWQSGWKERTS